MDVAVLEVGLGGRLDATNVADPVASAIVSIDFDHEVYLGRTLAAIAGEKAGVMRAGRPTVVGPLPDEARRAVLARARVIGARVVEAERGARYVGPCDLLTPSARYAGLRPLPGAHQRDNLLVAIRLLEEAKREGLSVDLRKVPAAVARTRWPGRLERVAGDPPLVLDGAHNPAGARALAAHLAQGPPFVLVFAAMADKDVRGLARELFPLAAEIVLTRPRVSRAATPDELARRCGRLASARPPGAERRPRPPPRPASRPRARAGHARGGGGQPLPRRRRDATPSRPSLAVRRGVCRWSSAAVSGVAARSSRRRISASVSAESHSAGPTTCRRTRPSRSSTNVSG